MTNWIFSKNQYVEIEKDTDVPEWVELCDGLPVVFDEHYKTIGYCYNGRFECVILKKWCIKN